MLFFMLNNKQIIHIEVKPYLIDTIPQTSFFSLLGVADGKRVPQITNNAMTSCKGCDKISQDDRPIFLQGDKVF